jgi:hypothetical protein
MIPPRSLVLSLALVIAICVPTWSQQSTASVEGTIVEAGSGTPMGKTTVETPFHLRFWRRHRVGANKSRRTVLSP